MSKLDFATLTDEELKHYFLEHRDDIDAFHAYIDRRHTRPSQVGIKPNDPDWEDKVIASIRKQLDK